MCHRLCNGIHLMVLAVGLARFSDAQPAMHTRVFRTAGSYPSVVSVSPSGSVLCKSGDYPWLTQLDGFNRRDISIPPEEIIYRVHQSRSGQIWSVSNQGLLLKHTDNWILYTLPEIPAFLAVPSRHLRQIALLPAEVNHVLVLFPDKLLDFDATLHQTRILKEASATKLGEFSEIQEGIGDSIWISGTYGIARIQGPARFAARTLLPRVTPQGGWEEFTLPDTNRVNGLQRVYELSPGDLTCSANCLSAENRAIVHLRNGAWSSTALPGERIRQAWRAWDDSVWGFSTISLFHVTEFGSGGSGGAHPGLRREPVAGALFDIAVETNGVFWVASGEGLIRYAPYLWRTPRPLEDIQSSVQSVLLPAKGSNVWLSTPAGLIEQNGENRRTYPWPEELENLPPRQSFRLPDGRFLVEGQDRPFLLDARLGRFTRLETAPALHVHLVGALKDGTVCAWFEHNNRDAPLDLRLFHGENFESIELRSENWNRGEVTFVKEGANGDLWICQGANLLRVRKNSGTVEHHGAENGLRTDRIYALAEFSEGHVWCGTAGRIYEYRGQRWEPILSTLDRVTDIVPARGGVWVSTLAGIYRFQENSWLSYGGKEGLPGGAVYTLRVGPDEQIWAGTSRGVFVFHPDADLDPPRALTPVLDESEKPAAGEPIVIRFRGQDKWDYTFPNDLLFAYRLDEGSWTSFSNATTHVFQKLAAGNHFVETLAMDRNGNKAASPGRLEFAVIVPWFHDPRLLSVSVLALCSSFVLAGLAVNKHFQLKRSYARVEQIVAERTHELDRANQELLHSQKMRALGTMAAGIAHDFNNILSIIKGSAQIIENNVQDPEKIRTRVSRIQLVVEQGTVIVKALLGLGKTEQKDLADCDITALLHETRKLLADRFPETIQFQINAPPDLPLVQCAPEVLQQILLNLILNAADAMHNNGVVELSATSAQTLPEKLVLDPAKNETHRADPLFVIISVIDQGGGISPENLPRIFEPFFTTKAFSTRRGTGLGLSMVYELAKAQGYGLAVDTHVGQGSAFSIILPAAGQQAAAETF